MRFKNQIVAASLIVSLALVSVSSAQLLYSFEDGEEDWVATQIVGEFDDNFAILESVPDIGNTHGENSLQIYSEQTGWYVRTAEVTFDPDRVEMLNDAILEGGMHIEFDWTVVASENPSAQQFDLQLALNADEGWTQVDMNAANGWPVWDPAGDEVQTITASVPLEDFGRSNQGYCCGVELTGFSNNYRMTIAATAGDLDADNRTYYLDNFRLVDPTQRPPDGTVLQAGDADQNLSFDQLDIVKILTAAKYLTGIAATWGEGDWDGAPGGSVGSPPAGNGFFDQLDIIAALSNGLYLTGPYGALAGPGQVGDEQTSLVYDASTGELSVDAPSSTDLTSIFVTSASNAFLGDKPAVLDGPFDSFAADNIFKSTIGASFGDISFGNVLAAGLSQDAVTADLSASGSLDGGGGLGDVDLVYIPEPSSITLLILGLFGLLSHLWPRWGSSMSRSNANGCA